MKTPRGPGGSDQPPVDRETDPAYSGQYGGQYWGPHPGYPAQPTQQLPPLWHTENIYPTPPPEPPKSSRWPWIATGALVILVSGLVLALVIVSSSAKDDTVVAPPTTTSAAPSPTSPRTTPVPSPPKRSPSVSPTSPARPTTSEVPPNAPAPTGNETVVYAVTGVGRAISITYVETGGILQTEFNVVLPWRKEVSLAAPARNAASVAVLNIGREVTCSIAVNGAPARQQTGRGLTVCTGMA